MSENTADSSATMKIKMGTQKFKKLEVRVADTVARFDRFKRYLNIAKLVLGQFQMSGQGSAPGNLPDPEEDNRLMATPLPPASVVYSDDYFRAPCTRSSFSKTSQSSTASASSMSSSAQTCRLYHWSSAIRVSEHRSGLCFSKILISGVLEPSSTSTSKKNDFLISLFALVQLQRLMAVRKI